MRDHRFGRPLLHPLHAILLAFPLALFCFTLATDITYLNTAEMQWSNFSAWSNAAGMVFATAVVLWAIVAVLRHRRDAWSGRARLYLVLVSVMWVMGLLDAFQHSHDAWSSVETSGLVLSILCAVLALAAALVGHAAVRTTSNGITA